MRRKLHLTTWIGYSLVLLLLWHLPTRGIREFVVGTGGAHLCRFKTIQPNSEVRDTSTWGVLKLILHPTSYEWEFVPVVGGTFRDAGSAACVLH